MSTSLPGDRRGTAGAGERREEVSEFTWLGTLTSWEGTRRYSQHGTR